MKAKEIFDNERVLVTNGNLVIYEGCFDGYPFKEERVDYNSKKGCYIQNKYVEIRLLDRRDREIHHLHNILSDELFKAEYSFDNDCYIEMSASASVEYKGYYFSVWFNYENGKNKIMIDEAFRLKGDSVPSNLIEALEAFMKKHFDFEGMYDNIMDMVKESQMTEWQWHGFDSEADYWHYRMG